MVKSFFYLASKSFRFWTSYSSRVRSFEKVSLSKALGRTNLGGFLASPRAPDLYFLVLQSLMDFLWSKNWSLTWCWKRWMRWFQMLRNFVSFSRIFVTTTEERWQSKWMQSTFVRFLLFTGSEKISGMICHWLSSFASAIFRSFVRGGKILSLCTMFR